MAARKRNLCDDATRQKIQTSQLLNRLQNNALGKLELSAIQQRSIEILLRKILPDLSAVDHSGEVDHNITGARWLTEAESLALTTIHEKSFDPSTAEQSDGPSLSLTDEPGKPSPASMN